MTRVPVERLQPGAVLVLPNGKRRTVVRVEKTTIGLNQAEAYIVTYVDNVLHGWDYSRWTETTIDGLEKQLRPLLPGDKVQVDEQARQSEAA